MEKKTKIIIGISALALVGVGVYLLTRKGGSGSGSGSGSRSSLKWESPLSYMSHRDGGKYPIHLANRPPSGTFGVGDTITIEGAVPFAGTYPAISTWNDAKGNIGAVYVALKGYVPNGNDDRSYEGKAIIKVT